MDHKKCFHRVLQDIKEAVFKKKKASKDRRNNFFRRTKPTVAPSSTTEAAPVETTTPKYTRRGNSRFKSRNDIDKPARNDTSRQPSLSGGVGARNERPRNFVRRKLGGANATTTTITTVGTPSSPAPFTTRRPFRVVAARRRPLTSTTRVTTTFTVTTSDSSTTEPSTTIQQGYEESLQDIIDADSQTSVASSETTSAEDEKASSPMPKKTIKIQRRPLVSLKDEDQNPSATNEEERKRQSKKYSSSFRQNQLDEVLKQKRLQEVTTVIGTTMDEYDAETALAIAAHQLITAPLPTSVNDLDDIQAKRTSPPRTTVDYSFTSPAYTAKSSTSKPVFIEEFSTATFKSSSVHPTYLTDEADIYTGQEPSGFSRTSLSGIPTGFTKSPTFSITAPESNPGPSTARYFAGNRRFNGVLNNIGYSQEPAYFTREYLLESPVTKTYDDEYQYLSPTTPASTSKTLPRKTIYRKISTTVKPTSPQIIDLLPATTPVPRRVASKKPYEKINKSPNKDYNKVGEYLPDKNFDYYDDQNDKVVQKYAEGTKVVLHGKGSIECLDIGNFPHPSSCKKFISCARLEFGGIIGWEYVCPSGLSFDPVGGMCNWAAGLGCDEKRV